MSLNRITSLFFSLAFFLVKLSRSFFDRLITLVIKALYISIAVSIVSVSVSCRKQASKLYRFRSLKRSIGLVV